MLTKLNTIKFPLSDKIFDYFLYLSSADEAADEDKGNPYPSNKVTPNNSQLNSTNNLIQNNNEHIELESFNGDYDNDTKK
jgi:hypothetical protein